MNIRNKGVYVVCGNQFSAIIKVIGEFPHFKIVSGILLDPFIAKGEVIKLDKDSLELTMITEMPDKFVYCPINEIGMANLPGLDKHSEGKVEFDEIEIAQWVDAYREIKTYNLSDNNLIIRIMASGRSYPQAKLVMRHIDNKLKRDEKNRK